MFNKEVGVTELLNRGYRYALSLCNTEAEAEDLVHDAWLRLATTHRKKIVISLLITTVRNLYMDRYRRSRLVITEAYDEEPAAAVPERNILPHEMASALGKIRPEEREAIYLNIVEGYTAREIAEITESPRNTILSLIHRGKKKLADLLEEPSDREAHS